MKYKRLKMSKPIPVMLDQQLLARIEAMSQRLGEAKSTVMRIAMRYGLEDLEKMDQARPVRALSPQEVAAAAQTGASSGRSAAGRFLDVVKKHIPPPKKTDPPR